MPYQGGRYVSNRDLTAVKTLVSEIGMWRCWDKRCRRLIEEGTEYWCHCGHVFCSDHAGEQDHCCTNISEEDIYVDCDVADPSRTSQSKDLKRIAFDKPGLFDAEEFPFLIEMAKHWETIRGEVEALHGEGFILWPERDLYSQKGSTGTGWEVYGLYSFGNKLEENCVRCPETTRLVESVPGMKMAGFSVLRADSYIAPHKGYAEYSEGIFRAHLGLSVPPLCRLRCAGETATWYEGEWLIFDDTQLHEAWNENESTTRIVLLMDFATPPGYATASEGLLGFTHGAAHLSGREPGDHVKHLDPGEHLKHIPGAAGVPKQF